MRAISRHRDPLSSKMRLLILSAVLACAAAAPSGFIAPIAAVPGVPVIQAYSAVPTISPGDVQAAVIDAQVKAEDLNRAADDRARELSDKARELAEQATENVYEKTISTNDELKEKAVEDFWSVEDKKWQAVDALKTAEAQIDGSVASQAPVLAKSAVLLPYAAAPVAVPFPGAVVAPIAPVVAPVPAIYPGFVAPVVKTAEPTPVETPEPVKAEEKESEPLVKAGEEANKDAVAVDSAALAIAKPLEARPFVASVYAAALPAPFGFPAPFGYPYHQIGLAPYIAKSVW